MLLLLLFDVKFLLLVCAGTPTLSLCGVRRSQ
jgi:hypothetical protein